MAVRDPVGLAPSRGPGLVEALIGEIGLTRGAGRVRTSGAGGLEYGRGGISASPRARTMWQLSQSSNAVVLKKIARGGTGTAQSLRAQMAYLFGKAEGLFGNMVEHDPEARSLSEEERLAIAADWSAGWRGNPKNGHTTHLLISFPAFVKPAKAQLIAEAWAAEMFQSGAHQHDEWAYVAALHTDRSHPHVHIVLNNRGLVNGFWFFMAKGHAFNLAVMKERLAGIAEEEGVYLDCSSRRDRGILSYGPTRAEIERARREERAPREVLLSGPVLEAALAEVRANAAVLKDLAMVAELGGLARAADRMREASEVLARGGIIQPLMDVPDKSEGGPPMAGSKDGREVEERGRGSAVESAGAGGEKAREEREAGGERRGPDREARAEIAPPATRRGLETYFADWLSRTEDKIAALPPERQAPLWRELRDIASDVVRTLGDSRGAELMTRDPVSRLHGAELTERGDGRATLTIGRDQRDLNADEAKELKASLRAAATEAGIDPSQVEARLARPAPSAFQERERVTADLRDVAERQKLDLSTEEGRTTAARRVDAFYAQAAKILDKALAIERVAEAVPGLPRALKAMAEVRVEAGQLRFESEAQAAAFAGDMAARYGKTAMQDLARGKDDALKRDFPDPAARAAIARAVMTVATVHETTGLSLAEAQRGIQLWDARAKEMEAGRHVDADRRSSLSGDRDRERQLTRDRSRDREL
ncbi:relaxase/mobilization nuclease-like protein [Gemmobacter caeni]|uniref:Relaxase/mobilization nuclease-like protein n=1 Tax=Gemmobacter caeni TaxID=589035 RepID=A0A2T6ADE0_9RHOB|nr:relaxase/mobilization nuclease domain-containing protein [Gemmobacter caeni]PTX41829.1 relaxase/mobilization nuclease-like protein [Gemmobacter caeni]TWI90608.1 relaxase/mobilization nuclease-like protein [Gemmobacter caeni]